MSLTQERLKELLDYDPETGVFHWKVGRSWRAPIGSVAGSEDAYGYTQICISQKVYKAHRLAWLYVHGRWPRDQIDHINLNKADNRIGNLREASHSENMRNTPAKGRFPKGVQPDRRGKKFTAQVSIDGARIFLGTFPTPEQAHDAYLKAARAASGEFVRAA